MTFEECERSYVRESKPGYRGYIKVSEALQIIPEILLI